MASHSWRRQLFPYAHAPWALTASGLAWFAGAAPAPSPCQLSAQPSDAQSQQQQLPRGTGECTGRVLAHHRPPAPGKPALRPGLLLHSCVLPLLLLLLLPPGALGASAPAGAARGQRSRLFGAEGRMLGSARGHLQQQAQKGPSQLGASVDAAGVRVPGRGLRQATQAGTAGDATEQQQQPAVADQQPAADRQMTPADAVVAALRRFAYLDGAAAAEAVAAAEAEAGGTGIAPPAPAASGESGTAQQPPPPRRASQLPQPRSVILSHLRHAVAMPSTTKLRAVLELRSGAGRWLAAHTAAYPALNGSCLGAWAAGANAFLDVILRRHYGLELQPAALAAAAAAGGEGGGGGGERGLLQPTAAGAGADADADASASADAAQQAQQQQQQPQQQSRRATLQQAATVGVVTGAVPGIAAVAPCFRTVPAAAMAATAASGGAGSAVRGGAGGGAMQAARVPLAPAPGLPLLRRVLLSQLVAAWLTGDVSESDLGSLGAGAGAGARAGAAAGAGAGAAAGARGAGEPGEAGASAAPAALLARMFALLYAIHRQSVEARGVLQHLHISKSGGTSWGEAAGANGCVSPPTLGKHVRGFSDECRWIDMPTYLAVSRGHRILWGRWGMVERPDTARTCRQRFAAVAAPDAGYSFISNEYTLLAGDGGMYDAHLCPQFVNVVTVREPLRRQHSHMRFMLTLIKAYWLKRNPDDGEDVFHRVVCGANASFVRQLAPPVADNYMLRSFLGERGFHSPLGTLGPEAVAAASDQLLQFDLVLDLDAVGGGGSRGGGGGTGGGGGGGAAGGGGGGAAAVMALGLGWNATLAESHTLATDSLHYHRKLDYRTCHPADEALREIRAAQGPDRQLYSFARVVNQLDVMWLEAAAELTAGVAPAADTAGLMRCGWLHRGANGSALAAALGPQRLQHWLHPLTAT